MSFLQFIDIFGVQPEWNYKFKTKYKTIISGLASLICYVFMIVLIIFFGKDFFFRLNPKVIGTNVFNSEYQFKKLRSDQGILAWYLSDANGRSVNFTNTIFPKVIYRTSQLNHDTSEQVLIQSKELPIKLCSDVKNLDPILKISFLQKTWYCIDFTGTDFELGGNWDNQILGYFYIMIDSCNEDKSYCCSIKEFRDLTPGIDNNLFFNVVYPDHYFTPENIENPLNYQYQSIFQTIDMNIVKRNYVTFKDVTLEDDFGWLYPDITNKTIFVFDNLNLDTYYRSDYDYNNINKEANTAIYIMEIYFSKDSYVYKRSFMKIQDLIAIVGGLIKAIIIVFSIVMNFYNNLSYTTDLINSLFVFSTNQLKTEFNRIKLNSDSIIIMNNKNHIQSNPYKLRKLEVESRHFNSLSYKKLFVDKLCYFKKTNNIVLDIVLSRLDIKTYMTGTFLFDAIVDLFLDGDQKKCFKYQGRYDLCNTDVINYLNEGIYGKKLKLNDINEYYKNNIDKKDISGIDQKIINYLNMLN